MPKAPLLFVSDFCTHHNESEVPAYLPHGTASHQVATPRACLPRGTSYRLGYEYARGSITFRVWLLHTPKLNWSLPEPLFHMELYATKWPYTKPAFHMELLGTFHVCHLRTSKLNWSLCEPLFHMELHATKWPHTEPDFHMELLKWKKWEMTRLWWSGLSRCVC